MQPKVFEDNYRIRFYEADYKKRALITSLMNYFDDLAIRQSENLGVGIDYLKQKNLAWMLYKWDIKIHKYPAFNQTVKVRTSAYSFVKFYAYRWFQVISKEGEELAKANSIWLLVDTQKKRPKKITEDLCRVYGAAAGSPLEIGKIQKANNIQIKKEFEVRYSDIDTNRHVNNVKYAAWALETVPFDIVLNYTLKRLKVTYKKETTYGKTVVSCTQVSKNDSKVSCLHKIVDSSDKELCLLESVWEYCPNP